jgi:diadenosine tetraphosphate (Ap4A) HIT family hydrolase
MADANVRDEWNARVAGTGCPLCAPRPESNDHWDLVVALSVSSLYLAKNQTYRGQCQLVFDLRHVARLDQLTEDEYGAFAGDLFVAQDAVGRAVSPDHVNIESLGNVVPHLHWHIVPRYVGDARWGMPIWTTPLHDMLDHRLPDRERRDLIHAIQRALSEGAHAGH